MKNKLILALALLPAASFADVNCGVSMNGYCYPCPGSCNTYIDDTNKYMHGEPLMIDGKMVEPLVWCLKKPCLGEYGWCTKAEAAKPKRCKTFNECARDGDWSGCEGRLE